MERNIVAMPFEIFPNTTSTSRDSTAIDISQLVTDLVTVNGTMIGFPARKCRRVATNIRPERSLRLGAQTHRRPATDAGLQVSFPLQAPWLEAEDNGLSQTLN